MKKINKIAFYSFAAICVTGLYFIIRESHLPPFEIMEVNDDGKHNKSVKAKWHGKEYEFFQGVGIIRKFPWSLEVVFDYEKREFIFTAYQYGIKNHEYGIV